MYLLARGLDKSMYAGTNIAFFTLANAIKLFPYVALGLTRPQALWGALALAPAVPIGVWLGKRLHDRLRSRGCSSGAICCSPSRP